jgi:hypothetical protein
MSQVQIRPGQIGYGVGGNWNDGIMRAYENDPRSRIAQELLKPNTAPVANGKWGIYEGLGRVLSSLGGAFIEKNTRKKYDREQTDYDTERNDILHKVLADAAAGGNAAPGNGGVGVSPAPQGAVPVAGGAGTGPNLQNGLPPQPVPPPAAPQAQPVVPPMAPNLPAGGPQGAPRPLPAPSQPGAPPMASSGPEIGVPEPPMPQAPADPGAGRARTLQIAEALMGAKSPYLRREADKWLIQGTGDQESRDTAATERQYRTAQTGYQAQLGDYYDTRGDNRRAKLTRAEAQAQFKEGLARDKINFGYDLTKIGKQEAAANYRAGMSANNAMAIARMQEDGEYQRALVKYGHNRDAFLQSPTGIKMFQAQQQRIAQNDDTISMLERFGQLNTKTGTGGISRVVPDSWLGSWNGDRAEMRGITEKLATLVRQAGSGAMSDKEQDAYRAAVPNINNFGSANKKVQERLILGAKRMNDYERLTFEAAADGRQVDFMKEWRAYRNNVSAFDPKAPTFEKWRESIPKVDANGQRIP